MIKTHYLENTREMFLRAYSERYAVGAFNVNHTEQIQTIVETASELRSPVILQASAFTANYVDLGFITVVADYAASKAGVPIALHLDHGADFKTVCQFIEAGFTSVMIDGSHLSFEENIALTKKVCDYAHPLNVTVEGELGTISGIEDDLENAEGLYTDPMQAKEFVERTGVDSLAVAVGTSHGAYKFKPGQDPRLRLDILAEIEKTVPNVPLVLHGASSVNQENLHIINQYGGSIHKAIGIPEEILSEASASAICKVNMDTDLRLAMAAAIRKTLSDDPSVLDTRKYLGAGRDAVAKLVHAKMTDVLHSANRY